MTSSLKNSTLKTTARLFVLSLSFILLATSTQAQSPTWDWVANGSLLKTPIAGGITTYAVAPDKNGNVYFGGLIADSTSIGGTVLGSAGGSDIMLGKTNSLGAIQWVKKYGTANADQLIDMVTDTAGNMYAQIWFGSPSFTMDGQTVTSLIFGVCIAKFDINGICTRARTTQNIALSYGGLAYSPAGFMAAVNGNVIAKVNMNCDTIWTRNIPGGLNTNLSYRDVTIDHLGNIVACGQFGGNVQFGTFTLTTPSTADLDNFVVKYDPNGTVLWARQSGSRLLTSEYAQSVAVDQSGYVFMVGEYTTKIGFGTDTLRTTNPFSSIYMAKYSPTGAYRWALNGISTNANYSRKIVCDPQNNLWIAFNPGGTFNFAGADHTPNAFSATMIVSVDTAGQFRSRLRTEGLGLSDPRALAFNNAGTAFYVGGWHVASNPTVVTFGTTTLNTSGNFIAKATPGVPTDVRDENALPTTFTLDQNYPNPFNPKTTIAYTLKERSEVKIEVFNLTGQLVNVLVDQPQGAGSYRLEWDGHDQQGNEMASGLYFYRLSTNLERQTKKMLLVR